MTKLQLTESERRIWESAYGAAWVRAFYDALRLRHQTNSGGWDQAIVHSYVEEAETVADQAVRELRRWRDEGNSTHDERGAPRTVEG